jgi:hypothetical protein
MASTTSAVPSATHAAKGIYMPEWQLPTDIKHD